MLLTKQKLGLLAVATCSLSLLATSARASIIFNQSQTGLDLFNNADVTFPAFAPTLNGNSIDFSTGTNGQALMIWDLLPAAPRGELDISIAIDHTPLSNDSDPIFALFDGSNFLALSRFDNRGGGIFALRGSATRTALLSGAVEFEFNRLGPVKPFAYDLWIADGGAGPASLNNFVEGTNSVVGPLPYQGNFIDTDNALSFALYRPPTFASTERYRINSIEIVIEEKDVPEPGMLLGTLAALGIGFMTKRISRNRFR